MILRAVRTLTPLSVVCLVACFDPYFQAHDLARDGDQDGVVKQDDCDDDDPFVTFTVYNTDGDLDGYGVPGTPVTGCERPEGYAENDDDCDDTDPNLWFESWWYVDQDLDGFGVGEAELRCAGYGTSLIDGDCDDARADVNPDAEEVCDGTVDDNCDGLSDCAVTTGEQDEDAFFASFDGTASDLGYAVSSAGDANGDGLADLVLGIPGQSTEDEDEAGAIALIYGAPPRSWDANDEGVAAALLVGSGSGDRMGEVVASAGDVDGDGMDDLIVGAPYLAVGGRIMGALGFDFPDGGGEIPGGGTGIGAEDAGAVFVVYSPLVPGTQAADDSARVVELSGPDENAHAGAALAGIGDLNEDGYGDFAVGAPLLEQGGKESGGAYLIMGPVLEDDALTDSAEISVTGDDAYMRLGQAICDIGDIDGDGLDDLAVGAPTDADPSSGDEPRHATGIGAVYVVLEPSGDEPVSNAAQVVVYGSVDAMFGRVLAGGEDIDGDGAPDLVVGAPGAVGSAGSVSAWSGASIAAAASTGTLEADALFLIEGPSADAELGTAFDLIPDMDGDDGAELAVGYPNRREQHGALLLYMSPVAGTRTTEDADLLIAGSTGGRRLGFSVAFAGDVNGLGVGDILVGAVKERGDPDDPPVDGAAYLLLGDGY